MALAMTERFSIAALLREGTLARGGFGRGRALQIRGVADSKSSAQRVGALCIAGLTRRMASHVLPCSRELMRSATELSEDSKGTRTFLWPWVQHLAAQATAACGGSREPEQGQRSKFSSAAHGATKILGTATR
jgi:hypothetical protein